MSKKPPPYGEHCEDSKKMPPTSFQHENEEARREAADAVPSFHAMLRPLDGQLPSSRAASIRSSSQESLSLMDQHAHVAIHFQDEASHHHLPSSAVSHASDAQRSDLATVCSGSVVHDDIEVESVHSHQDRLPAALAGATLSSPSPPAEYVAAGAAANASHQGHQAGASLSDWWHAGSSETASAVNRRSRPTPNVRNQEAKPSSMRRGSAKSVASSNSSGDGTGNDADASSRLERASVGFEEVMPAPSSARGTAMGDPAPDNNNQQADVRPADPGWQQPSRREDYDPRLQGSRGVRSGEREAPKHTRDRSRSRSRTPSPGDGQ